MKQVALLFSTILTGALLNTAAAVATSGSASDTASPMAAAPASATDSASGQDTSDIQKTASRIIGNINIATLALSEGMHADASTHITAARKDIAALNGQMASYDSITAGKLSYKTDQSENAYWIPVENDHFVVRTFKGKHLDSKNPDLGVTDAQMVHFKMVLNTKMADQALATAQSAIGQKKYDDALGDLENLSKAAITETTLSGLPLEGARDNLILSRELLEDKDYRGASFALKHAEKDLAQAQDKDTSSADKADMQKMQSQIHRLQASITQQKPSMLKTSEMKIDGWIKDVKEKLHAV